MTYRLPSERVTIEIDHGPSVQVERLGAWSLYWAALALASAAIDPNARPGAQFEALRNLGAYFVAEAQPAWDIADHRGPIPVTTDGFMRLPVPMAMQIVDGWIETHIEKASAVDEIIPPGEAREELKRRLREKRVA